MTEDIRNISIVIIVCIAIILAGAFVYGRSNVDPLSIPENQVKLERPDSLTIGSKNGKVKIIEFADFECPACAIGAETVLKLINDYKDQISFVFRHFPLEQHSNAFLASKAGEAANEQGKFKEMYEKIYTNRPAWGDKRDPQTEVFVGFAKDLGLDVVKFRADLASDKYDSKIKRDKQDGIDIGVNSTPTFFINNKEYVGALTYDDLKKIVELNLSK